MQHQKASSPGIKQKLRSILKGILPESIWRLTLSSWKSLKQLGSNLGLLREMAQDFRRYAAWSHGVGLDKHRSQRERALIKAFHGFEKGMSLAEPRPGFGQDKARLLIEQIEVFHFHHGYTGMALTAIDVLRAYRDFNRNLQVEQPWLDDWLEGIPVQDRNASAEQGGTVKVEREDILRDVASSGASFFSSRHSIRQFAAGPVPVEAVRAAMAMALKTPSACNRQGPHVFLFQNAMDALKWQPGNRGFGHLASRALVITSDLSAFSGPGERHQAWVDGGMFAMSAIYALHSMGYGTCALAWNARTAQDSAMRQALGIPDSHVVMMMIAVGTLPSTFNVAKSQRFPLDEILVIK